MALAPDLAPDAAAETPSLDLVLPGRAGPSGLLQGPEALRLMGEAAHACAARRAGGPVVMARADSLEFRKPARLDDELRIRARIAFQGATSLTVLVSVFVAHAPEAPAAVGRFMMVAVDSEGLPTPLPPHAAEKDALS